MTTSRIIRAVGGIAALLVLVVMVNGWWGDYRDAADKRGAGEATATATATQTPPAATGPAVLVLVDGLNFRTQPDATGATIRGLKKGEYFVLVGQTGAWLQLKDPTGQVGWVNNNPQYIKIDKKK